MVKGQDTVSGVNKVETTAGVRQQSGFTFSAADNFQHAPTVKMVHNNYNTTLCKRSKTNSKTTTKTIGANFRLGRVILVAAALIVILSSL